MPAVLVVVTMAVRCAADATDFVKNLNEVAFARFKMSKIPKLLRTRCVPQCQNAPKRVLGRSSAPDSAEEAYDAPPLVGWEGYGKGYPPLDAFGVSTGSTANSFSTNSVLNTSRNHAHTSINRTSLFYSRTS